MGYESCFFSVTTRYHKKTRCATQLAVRSNDVATSGRGLHGLLECSDVYMAEGLLLVESVVVTVTLQYLSAAKSTFKYAQILWGQ